MDTEGSENSIIFNRRERGGFLDRITGFFLPLRHEDTKEYGHRVHREIRELNNILPRITQITRIFLASLVFLAGSFLKASFVIEACLRPPGSLVLPTYD